MSKASEKEYEAPAWPQWIEQNVLVRVFAGFDLASMTIFLEDGTGWEVTTQEEFEALIFDQNLLVYTYDIEEFPFLPDVRKPGQVPCTQPGLLMQVKPTSIKYIGPRNSTRWVASIKSWDERDEDGLPIKEVTYDFLRRRREECELLQCGTHGSPGSQGQAFWRRVWREHGYHRHYQPNQGCIAFIRSAASLGGDASAPGQRAEPYPDLVALDRVRGYPAEFGDLPTGTAGVVFADGEAPSSDHMSSKLEYIVDCHITIHEELPRHLFAVKLADGSIIKPTKPGEYFTKLWKCEAELAEEQGCEVKCYTGFCWRKTTNQHTTVVKVYEQLLREAPEQLVGHIKKIFMGGMGFFGMGNVHYSMVSAEYATPGDVPLTLEDGRKLDAYLHQDINIHQPQMLHWYGCIAARMRVALARQELAMMEAGVIILYDNFDEIGGLPHPYFEQFEEKSSSLPTGVWGKVEYIDAIIAYNRFFDGTNKKTGKRRHNAPGQARARPERRTG